MTENVADSGAEDNEAAEGPTDVRTVPTLGHQPVILGGLYSGAEDEFIPGL